MMNQTTEIKIHSQSEALLKRAQQLEAWIRSQLQSRSPFDASILAARHKLRDAYETLVLSDGEFAESHNILHALWRLHYKRIEEFRAAVRKFSQSSSATETQVSRNGSQSVTHGTSNGRLLPGRGPVIGGRGILSSGQGPGFRQPTTGSQPVMRTGSSSSSNLTKALGLCRSFLAEASGFFHDLVGKLKAQYGLPQDYSFSDLQDEETEEEANKTALRRCRLFCHRCYIYLGDLHRYKQLFVGDGNATAEKGRDWSVAASYYLQAATLLPEAGNPHNQLAVLANYSEDELLAVYHYCRSLASRSPFLNARENLKLQLEKSLAQLSLTTSKADVGVEVGSLEEAFVKTVAVIFQRQRLELFVPLLEEFTAALRRPLGLRSADDGQKVASHSASRKLLDADTTVQKLPSPPLLLQVIFVAIFTVHHADSSGTESSSPSVAVAAAGMGQQQQHQHQPQVAGNALTLAERLRKTPQICSSNAWCFAFAIVAELLSALLKDLPPPALSQTAAPETLRPAATSCSVLRESALSSEERKEKALTRSLILACVHLFLEWLCSLVGKGTAAYHLFSTGSAESEQKQGANAVGDRALASQRDAPGRRSDKGKQQHQESELKLAEAEEERWRSAFWSHLADVLNVLRMQLGFQGTDGVASNVEQRHAHANLVEGVDADEEGSGLLHACAAAVGGPGLWQVLRDWKDSPNPLPSGGGNLDGSQKQKRRGLWEDYEMRGTVQFAAVCSRLDFSGPRPRPWGEGDGQREEEERILRTLAAGARLACAFESLVLAKRSKEPLEEASGEILKGLYVDRARKCFLFGGLPDKREEEVAAGTNIEGLESVDVQEGSNLEGPEPPAPMPGGSRGAVSLPTLGSQVHSSGVVVADGNEGAWVGHGMLDGAQAFLQSTEAEDEEMEPAWASMDMGGGGEGSQDGNEVDFEKEFAELSLRSHAEEEMRKREVGAAAMGAVSAGDPTRSLQQQQQQEEVPGQLNEEDEEEEVIVFRPHGMAFLQQQQQQPFTRTPPPPMEAALPFSPHAPAVNPPVGPAGFIGQLVPGGEGLGPSALLAAEPSAPVFSQPLSPPNFSEASIAQLLPQLMQQQHRQVHQSEVAQFGHLAAAPQVDVEQLLRAYAAMAVSEHQQQQQQQYVEVQQQELQNLQRLLSVAQESDSSLAAALALSGAGHPAGGTAASSHMYQEPSFSEWVSPRARGSDHSRSLSGGYQQQIALANRLTTSDVSPACFTPPPVPGVALSFPPSAPPGFIRPVAAASSQQYRVTGVVNSVSAPNQQQQPKPRSAPPGFPPAPPAPAHLPPFVQSWMDEFSHTSEPSRGNASTQAQVSSPFHHLGHPEQHSTRLPVTATASGPAYPDTATGDADGNLAWSANAIERFLFGADSLGEQQGWGGEGGNSNGQGASSTLAGNGDTGGSSGVS